MNNYFKQVLFVGPHYQLRGGMASVLKVYAESLQFFNFLPTYFYKNPVLNGLYFLKSVLKLTWILVTSRDIKIVHIHTASRGSFFRKSVVVLLSKLFAKKVVLHIHGGEFKEYYNNAGNFRTYIRFILNKVDEVICLSEEWKTYFDSLTKKKKSIILNNPVMIPDTVPDKKISSPINILFLNHIDIKKGIFDLTDFFTENKSWLQGSFKLVIAGAGESEKLLGIISAHHLEELVEYKGWVSGKAKDDLINESDLFILPSYNEGLPVSILEAMAFRRPVIATNVGGIPRIVKPGENGWLMNPADKKALFSIFEQIKNETGMLERYGRRSFEIALDYSPGNVNNKLGKIYDNILAGEN